MAIKSKRMVGVRVTEGELSAMKKESGVTAGAGAILAMARQGLNARQGQIWRRRVNSAQSRKAK